MIKQFLVTATSFATLLSPIAPVLAIAPGTDQLVACGRFAANKYKVPESAIKASVGNRTNNGYYINWNVQRYGSSGYCFVTYNVKVSQFVVERGPKPNQTNPVVGPNEKVFYGLPGYGDVVVNRGQGASGDKQYFLVRKVSNNATYKWYARCANNSDQVYDHNGKYVGYDNRMSVMFPYVCQFSPLKPKPSQTPQPR